MPTSKTSPGARLRLTARERERQEVIPPPARRVLVLHGRAGIRLADLATALGMAAGTIPPLLPRPGLPPGRDACAPTLMAISTAIGDALRGIPHDAAHRQGTARAAYLAATRTVLGGHTEAHLLLLRERYHLPPDLLDTIEQTRAGLGEILAGEFATEALGLLDMPELSRRHDRRHAPRSWPPPPAQPPACKSFPAWKNPPTGSTE